MDIMLVVVMAALALAATAYVQFRLPVHTRHEGATWFLRALLAGVGALAGYLGMLWRVDHSIAMRWAAFLLGFGVAHVPAFFVLYIKRRRGEYGHG